MAGKIALSLLLVMTIILAPVRLSARTCILSNVATEKACQPGCCPNKTCCATSSQNTTATSQPFAKNGSAPELNTTFAAITAIIPNRGPAAQQIAFSDATSYAHAPPQLAVLCTFLI